MSLDSYSVIVVGTDGSPLSVPTVARAAWLAAHEQAELVIVCAFTNLSRRDEAKNVATLGGDSSVGTVRGINAANKALGDATEQAEQFGATVTGAILLEGDPAAVLLRTVTERAADVLVVGARQDVSIAERLLGTVASEVVRKAPCDVLIVRPRDSVGDLPVPEDV